MQLPGRRTVVALGVSLGVHALVLSLLQSEPASPRPSPRGLVLTELRWIDAQPTPPPGEAPSPLTPRKTAHAKAVPTIATPRKSSAPTTEPSTNDSAANDSAANDSAANNSAANNSAANNSAANNSAANNSAASDSRSNGAPVRVDLTPRASLVLPGGVGADTPRGRTLHPNDLPGVDELRAEEQERVATLVDGWARGGLAAARARSGLPAPQYGHLGAALRAATDDVPKFIDTNSPKEIVGAVLQSWGAGAERYGKTGAPWAEPEGHLESLERPSEVNRAASTGNADALAMASFLSAGARLQEFADGRAGLELFALVEIRQQASGSLEAVTLVRPSGLAPFDAWVMERARSVGASFTFDAGLTRTRPLRSVWRFDGFIVYRRKLELSKLDGRAALGMITMSALSMLSGVGNQVPQQPGSTEPPRDLGPRMPGLVGRFDETTGALDVVDLTNPTYDCKVSLVAAE